MSVHNDRNTFQHRQSKKDRQPALLSKVLFLEYLSPDRSVLYKNIKKSVINKQSHLDTPFAPIFCVFYCNTQIRKCFTYFITCRKIFF